MSELIPAGATRAILYPAQEWLHDREAWDIIPPEERDVLNTTVAEAVDLAELGQVAVGHEIVLTGLQRAEDHWNGNPWGRELVDCYQQALERYSRCYGEGALAALVQSVERRSEGGSAPVAGGRLGASGRVRSPHGTRQ